MFNPPTKKREESKIFTCQDKVVQKLHYQCSDIQWFIVFYGCVFETLISDFYFACKLIDVLADDKKIQCVTHSPDVQSIESIYLKSSDRTLSIFYSANLRELFKKLINVKDRIFSGRRFCFLS